MTYEQIIKLIAIAEQRGEYDLAEYLASLLESDNIRMAA